MDPEAPTEVEQRQPRRRFLKLAMAVLSLPVAAVFLGPMIQSFLAPLYLPIKRSFSRVARLADLPQDEPVKLVYPYIQQDAFLRETDTHDIWIIKHSDSQVTVYSPICTHLGCRYKWEPSTQQFVCPCHGSVFAKDGAVLAGPAPRPLDTLPIKIENGELYVLWERFEPGITRKVPVV